MTRFTPRLTQPEEMKTKSYIYGVDILNGDDAWAMFEAAAAGDGAKIKKLLAKDPRLVNAQYWYQFPIHMAVRQGHADIVAQLLAAGADPGQSRYTYSSWPGLLQMARDRGHGSIATILERAMIRKFTYSADFDLLKDAIIARSPRKIAAVLARHPKLVTASDALGNNALHWSVLTRQLGLIDHFIERGTPIDALRADGHSPVMLAAGGATDYWYRDARGRSHPSLRNAAVMVGGLLARGAEYTLSVAAAVGDQERIEQLLKKDAGLARRLDSAGVSPLAHAAHEGHRHIVRLLLEHGADPNLPEAACPQGAALYWASAKNHLEIAELLLEHGANPNAGMDSCECCLTIGAIYHGDRAKPLQELLSRHGAVMPPYRMNARQLMDAIRAGHEVVHHEEFLGNVMAKRNAKLLDRYLASDPTVPRRMQHHGSLTYPASPALVRTLLARGLDLNATDWLGRTFLHVCAVDGDRSIATLFLDAGADLNARDAEFQATPLAAAVRTCDAGDDPKQVHRGRRMIEFLLKRGAATNLPGDEPWATPLAWARTRGLEDVERMLRQYGAT